MSPRSSAMPRKVRSSPSSARQGSATSPRARRSSLATKSLSRQSPKILQSPSSVSSSASPRATLNRANGFICTTAAASSTSARAHLTFTPAHRETTPMHNRSWTGYLRPDGRKGIRNHLLVVYTVECASFVAQEIARGEPDVHVIGFPGCYDNDYAIRLMLALATHPNIGGVLCVGL